LINRAYTIIAKLWNSSAFITNLVSICIFWAFGTPF